MAKAHVDISSQKRKLSNVFDSNYLEKSMQRKKTNDSIMVITSGDTEVGGEKNSNDEDEIMRNDNVGDDAAVITGSGGFIGSNNDSSDDEEFDKLDDKKKPVWIDEDDVITCHDITSVSDVQGRKLKHVAASRDYKEHLDEKYKSIMGEPKWAKKKKKVNLLTSTGSLVKKSTSLQKDVLEFQKLKHLNRETSIEGNIIKAVLFHPGATIGLVAGMSGVASLFQVDGRQNTKLQSIHFDKYTIDCAAFLRSGEEFLVGSKFHKYFYSHDLISGNSDRVVNSRLSDITNGRRFKATPDGKHIVVCGKYGQIYLLSAASKEYICSMQMNGELCAVDFYGDKMLTHGSEGEVYVWDLNTRDCVHKFVDDGCIQGTSLATAPNGLLLACGSSTGVVNIYDMKSALIDRYPSPLKVVYNLTTEVNSLKFNASSELLCMASDKKKNAMKMLHCESMSVFSNFPSFQDHFNRIQCIDFSPNSGYLACGDNMKTAHLYRLKYYGNY